MSNRTQRALICWASIVISSCPRAMGNTLYGDTHDFESNGSTQTETLAAPLKFNVTDMMAQRADEFSAHYKRTSEKNCEVHSCTTITSYWNNHEELVKTEQLFESEVDPSSKEERYYLYCQLILTRVTSLSKQDALPEKYYFYKGKITDVVFGNGMQHFGAEQKAYYE